MKKHSFLLALGFCMLPFWASAQETSNETSSDAPKSEEMQTLLGKKNHVGVFWGVSLKSSKMGEDVAMMPGMRVGMTLGRILSMGFEGYGLAPTVTRNDITTNPVRTLMGYGGFFIEPIIGSNQVVHITFPLHMGAGWAGYVDDWSDDKAGKGDLIDDSVFWTLEPGANLELNLTRHFRLNVGASYRFVNDLNLDKTSSSYLSGMNINVGIKLGRF